MSKEVDPADGTVNTVDTTTATTSGTNSPETGNKGIIPKCACSWKNCRVFQKFFRDHPIWDGVIRLKFTSTEPETMALKTSIDRNLNVPSAKADDWKSNKDGSKVCKYNVACHHWTEQHIRKFRLDSKHYSFTKPFSVHGAKKYLHRIDPRETIKDSSGVLLYLQSPLVPKEDVKLLFYTLKEIAEKGAGRNDKGTSRPASSSRALKDYDDDDQLYQKRQQAPHMPQQGADSVSGGRNSGDSNARRVEARDKKGPMKGLTHAERKDSLTVSSNRSSKTAEILLQEKELENKSLKEQLEAMQSQLSQLNDMVSRLQVEQYHQHAVRGGPRAQSQRLGPSSGHSARRRAVAGSGQGADGSSRRTGSRSSRSSVPNEIEIESEDDGNWVEEAIDEEWSLEDEDEDERSGGTFRVNQGMKRSSSFNSRASTRSRATSIVSSSKSMKSLPREIEMDEDDDSHESLEEEAFDNRSFASSKKITKASSQRNVSRRQRGSQPQSQQSTGTGSRASGTSTKSGKSNKDDDSSVGVVRQVTAYKVTDPYGEQGTYTGSISSTGMPHGFGRLEYEKAGRWYEGQWKLGRWTGQGRLSNGDGDFYEGGLHNDNKHGRGVMKFADGRIFDGDYENNQMVKGTMTYQDGSTYTGGWVAGMRHGQGRCVFTDQSVYEGEFREGEFFGFGKMSWSDGGWYKGEWFNGEMQGFGKEIRPDGSLRHEGQWMKGQPIRK